METKLFHFDTGGDGFLERRLVFVEAGEGDSDEVETEVSTAEKEAAKNFVKETLKFGNGVNTPLNNVEIKNIVSEVRDGVGETVPGLIDKIVSEKLKDEIAKIENLDPNHKKYEKKLTKAEKKYDSDDKINDEISKIDDKILELKLGKFGFSISKTEKHIRKREAEIEQLKKLLETREKESEKVETKMQFAHETSADFLEKDFKWLENATDADFKKNADYESLRNLLPAAELTSWKKNETTRALLFQLKNSKDYQNILNNNPVGEIETHLSESANTINLRKEENKIDESFDDLAKQFEEINTNIEITSSISLEDLKGKDVISVLTNMETIREKLAEKLDITEVGVKDFELAEKQLEKEKQELEELKKKKDERLKEIENKKIEWFNILKSTPEEEQKAGFLSSPSQNSEASKEAKKQIGILDDEKNDLNDKDGNLNKKISKLEGEINEANKNELQTTFKERKKVERTHEKMQKNISNALKVVDNIEDKLNRKHEINNEIKKIEKVKDKKTLLTPTQLFTNIEVELAKVKACEKYGIKDTAKLGESQAAEAERIGEMSARMKLEDYSGEKMKKENSALLERIAGENKSWLKRLGEGISARAGAAKKKITPSKERIAIEKEGIKDGFMSFFTCAKDAFQ